MVDTDFYRAFEKVHRGPRELIKSRLTAYLPFILPLRQVDNACTGVDLGCGRGEWLELMRENGIDVQGIDLDQGMLEAAHESGLNATHGDAIQHLQSLAPESQMLVTAFHLAEHLPFERLHMLVQEALRVLKPGGVLILETPNPENITVGTTTFYIDPTHQRPIPPPLLSFVATYHGFEKVRILKLQEAAGLADNDALTLMNVLDGVSPDYAVAAQKSGAPDISAATAPAFERECGLSLGHLADKYEQQSRARSAKRTALSEQNALLHAQIQWFQTEWSAAQKKADLINQHTTHVETELTAARQNAAQLAAELDSAKTYYAQLHAVYASTSWRITAPLRWIVNFVTRANKRAMTIAPHIHKKDTAPELTNLPPRARRIYAHLNAAIEKNRKEKA